MKLYLLHSIFKHYHYTKTFRLVGGVIWISLSGCGCELESRLGTNFAIAFMNVHVNIKIETLQAHAKERRAF